jgi:Cytochrome c7 and related cytochrome c
VRRWQLAAATAALTCTLAAAVLGRELAHVGVHQGYAPAQPIAFSHKLHAGDFRVPCLYCHFGARTSRHAGIPPANVCMNCHGLLQKQTTDLELLKELIDQQRPVAWIKVHNLPDFVYFNHSQHVTAGVECQTCHGHVERMTRVEQQAPLTMGWCIDCHRQRRTNLTVPAANLDCGKCHY